MWVKDSFSGMNGEGGDGPAHSSGLSVAVEDRRRPIGLSPKSCSTEMKMSFIEKAATSDPMVSSCARKTFPKKMPFAFE
jgi:hypothetical protein